MRQWNAQMNSVADVDRLLDENVVILENMENFAANSPTGSCGAPSSSKPIKKSTSKLGVKRKFDDIESESRSTLEDGLKSVTNSMSDIAQALAVANENFMKSNTRIYSATEIYAELEKYGVADDKILDVEEFLRANNEKADSFFGCPDRLKPQWLARNGF